MLRLPTALAAAARELGRLPELLEAEKLYASGEFRNALRHVERAVDVVRAVPIPAMQLVAGGVLAQTLRASGEADREAGVWKESVGRLSNGPDEAVLRCHALHGAVSSHLHLGDGGAAMALCDEAAPLVTPGTPLAASLGAHRSLARLLLRGEPSSGLVDQLRADVDARTEEMAASPSSDAAGAAVAGTSILLGDAHALAGDDEAAREIWISLAADGGGEGGGEGAAGVPLPAEHARALREVALKLRLGASWLRSGDAAASRDACTAAADLCEERLPPLHPLLPHTLGHLALALTAEGEFVTAEGLYRSATDTLSGAGGDAAVPVSHVPLLLPTLEAFATLLQSLETNGKPRCAEADQMRERARVLRVSYASALPKGTDAG